MNDAPEPLIDRTMNAKGDAPLRAEDLRQAVQAGAILDSRAEQMDGRTPLRKMLGSINDVLSKPLNIQEDLTSEGFTNVAANLMLNTARATYQSTRWVVNRYQQRKAVDVHSKPEGRDATKSVIRQPGR